MKCFFNCCVLLVLLSSCKSEEENYIELTTSLSKVNVQLTEGETGVIIIPGAGSGCGSCISQATSYVLDYIDTLSSNVVFTGVVDMKLFRLEVGDDFLANPKVFIDKENHLMNTHVSSIYPRQLTFSGKKIKRVVDFNPY